VLASLVHWFAHSNTSSEVPIHIPRSLAVPLVDVSRRLRVAPVLTFADTILWNWDLASSLRSDQPLSVDNMKFTNIFSRTEDESNFYIASAQAEFIGIEALHIMHAYSRLSVVQDDASVSQIAEGLTRMAEVVDHISAAVHDIRQMVNPRVFYDEVRPWFVGSTADRPWIYDGVDEQDLDLDGPSSGQSAIMHSLDVFLDVNHGTPKRPSPDPLQRGAVSGGFMQRMRRYMPGNQRDFLERLEVEHLGGSEHPVRDLARTHPQIRGPYNQAIRALTRLRDHHIRVATLYIVSMAKSAPMCPFIRGAVRQAEAIRTASAPAKGTGGNHVSTLLKAGRDATRRAVLAA
jgi:indoleamine 2,3-dioxygenase